MESCPAFRNCYQSSRQYSSYLRTGASLTHISKSFPSQGMQHCRSGNWEDIPKRSRRGIEKITLRRAYSFVGATVEGKHHSKLYLMDFSCKQ
jgi:hypothetical protein